MAEFYRFFDSTIDDVREYTAEEYSEYFRMVLTNGIYNGGTNLQVTAGGGSMTTDIADGYAMINGYLYKIYGGVTLAHDTADVTHNRIDRIVLRWDIREESRFIKAFILKGTPAETPVAPALTRTDEIYELSLAQVLVRAGRNNIAGSDVTDERLNTEVCGIFNSRIQADTTEIFNQFNAWYNLNVPAFEKAWDDWFKNQQLGGFVTNVEMEGFKTEVNASIATGLENVTNTMNQEIAKVDTAIKEMQVTNTLKTIKSAIDSEGIYTVVTYRRKADNTVYATSWLNGGTSPLYTMRKVDFYDPTGTSVIATYTYTLSYDEDGNLIGEE